tara:strand:+ start:9144 stop:9386 length:243 start_codon:yes stop_codon:yes gene_type:complete
MKEETEMNTKKLVRGIVGIVGGLILLSIIIFSFYCWSLEIEIPFRDDKWIRLGRAISSFIVTVILICGSSEICKWAWSSE